MINYVSKSYFAVAVLAIPLMLMSCSNNGNASNGDENKKASVLIEGIDYKMETSIDTTLSYEEFLIVALKHEPEGQRQPRFFVLKRESEGLYLEVKIIKDLQKEVPITFKDGDVISIPVTN